MFPKERKTNIKLDKLVVEKFPVVAISTMSSSPVATANHCVFRNLGLLSQELRFFQFDRPKTGCVRAKTCLTGQSDRRFPISYLQPCTW